MSIETRTADEVSDAENAEAARFTKRLQRIGWISTGVIVLLFLCAATWRNFLGLPINEMGDALAGFISGLAFLWLVLTMQLQIKELEMQRKELRLARIANEDQTTQLAGTREATQSELELLKVNQAMLLEERAKRMEDDAARAVLSTVLYDLIPTLLRSPNITHAASATLDWSATLSDAKTLLNGNKLSEGLSVLANLLDLMEMELDVLTALQDLSRISGIREKLELLSTLMTVFELSHHSAGQYRRFQYDYGVKRLESSLKWLLGATKDLPSATDIYQKQLAALRAGLDESERIAAEIRRSYNGDEPKTT